MELQQRSDPTSCRNHVCVSGFIWWIINQTASSGCSVFPSLHIQKAQRKFFESQQEEKVQNEAFSPTVPVPAPETKGGGG